MAFDASDMEALLNASSQNFVSVTLSIALADESSGMSTDFCVQQP